MRQASGIGLDIDRFTDRGFFLGFFFVKIVAGLFFPRGLSYSVYLLRRLGFDLLSIFITLGGVLISGNFNR